jgi:hypothetical protein
MKYIEQQHLGKVETDIDTSIAVRLIGEAVILVIMYVKTFRIDIIYFISNVIMCLMSHWQDNLQYQSQFIDTYNIKSQTVDTDNIVQWDKRKYL